MLATESIKQRALEAGFDLAGVAPPSALKDLQFLPQWIEQGYAGEMHYLSNARREDPRHVLPSVQSIVCVGLIYNTAHPYSTEVARHSPGTDSTPRGWISRYAWGRDYHRVMRQKLEKLRSMLEQQAPGIETRVYVDTGPVLERAFARISGIGWMGKNTCIINEQKGSWFFLGVILTNLELEFDTLAPDRCGSCTRCLDACPTGALTKPYVMDASRCIAYFNIELRGSIPEAFRAAIGNNVFGCDICQDVCPWNNRPLSVVMGPLLDDVRGKEHSGAGTTQRSVATTNLPEFQPLEVEITSESRIADSTGESEPVAQTSPAGHFSLFNPTLEDLASMTEEDFKRIFAHSPIKRPKHRGWLRNLCVVMGNSGDRRFIPWLQSLVAISNPNESPDPIVAEHAAWALGRLQDGADSVRTTS